MAERDRYGWDRGRDFGEREREYGHGNDRERAYINAMAIRYSADPKADRAVLARQYSEAIRMRRWRQSG